MTHVHGLQGVSGVPQCAAMDRYSCVHVGGGYVGRLVAQPTPMELRQGTQCTVPAAATSPPSSLASLSLTHSAISDPPSTTLTHQLAIANASTSTCCNLPPPPRRDALLTLGSFERVDTRAQVRRLMMTIATAGPAACLVGLATINGYAATHHTRPRGCRKPSLVAILSERSYTFGIS